MKPITIASQPQVPAKCDRAVITADLTFQPKCICDSTVYKHYPDNFYSAKRDVFCKFGK